MLTSDQEQRFRDHLRAVDGRETCIVCDASEWRAELLGGVEFVFIGRTCERCGHVLLFSPEAIGLIPGWRSSGALAVERCLLSLN